MTSTIQVYKKLPLGLRNILKSVYGSMSMESRLSKSFRNKLEFLEKSQWWSEVELTHYQDEELRKLIKHAYDSVPYYNRIFKEHKLTIQDVKSTGDLGKLPLLTKDDVRKYMPQLKSVNFKGQDMVEGSTSGTTGKPLRFYYDKSKQYFDFEPETFRFFQWGGYRVGDLIGVFLGWNVEGNGIYSYNPVRRLLILSSYKLNSGNVHLYGELLKKYNLHFLMGYPSIITLLSRFMKATGMQCPAEIKAIFLYGENYPESQRKIMEDFWGCKCFTNYGLKERCILGLECEHHSGLHLCSEFGITEFIANNEIDGFQKIVATSLTNYAMPLIRYDTGDIGRLSKEKCPCGRGLPLFELEGGRTRNFAITKNDSYVPISGLDLGAITDNILQYQFVQEKKGILDLYIIKKGSFQENDLDKIKLALIHKLGTTVDVNVRFTDALSLTSNYKNPRFIQKIKEAMAD